MNIINFFKRIFGIKSKTSTKVKQTTTETTNNHFKSDLNEITLKMNPNTEKPKKKRYYRKRPANKNKSTKDKNSVNNENKSNETTKKRNRTKKPKNTSTVQPESRSDQ
jgi:hypothetical protein